jgi:hypothetical protein
MVRTGGVALKQGYASLWPIIVVGSGIDGSIGHNVGDRMGDRRADIRVLRRHLAAIGIKAVIDGYVVRSTNWIWVGRQSVAFLIKRKDVLVFRKSAWLCNKVSCVANYSNSDT